jgi:hypothetical protein
LEQVDFEGGAKKLRDVILPSEYKTGILFYPVLWSHKPGKGKPTGIPTGCTDRVVKRNRQFYRQEFVGRS